MTTNELKQSMDDIKMRLKNASDDRERHRIAEAGNEITSIYLSMCGFKVIPWYIPVRYDVSETLKFISPYDNNVSKKFCHVCGKMMRKREIKTKNHGVSYWYKCSRCQYQKKKIIERLEK